MLLNSIELALVLAINLLYIQGKYGKKINTFIPISVTKLAKICN